MAQAIKKARSKASVNKSHPDKARPGKRDLQKDRPMKTKTSKRKPTQGATRNTQGPVARQRKSFAWFNWLLILVGAGVVLIAAVQAYVTLQGIPVQRISVTGALEHTQTEVVQEMVQPALAGGFLNADLQHIRRQLEGLPWIYEVTVRRKWPNALEIHVVEQLPIARWGSDGFLNHEGEVFHSTRVGQWQTLPLLQGPDGAARDLVAKYQRLLELLAPVGLAVEQLAVDERGQVEAVLAGGMQLIVGSDDFLERMRRFVVIYRTELAARAEDVKRVDLRYESGVAVAFDDSSEVAGL